VYKYCVENQYLKRLFRMKLSSNIMHGSYAISAKGSIYFGEYSSNSNRDSVPIIVLMALEIIGQKYMNLKKKQFVIFMDAFMINMKKRYGC